MAIAACNQNQSSAPSSAASQTSSLPPPLPLTTEAAPPPPPAPSASDLPAAPAADVAYLEDPLQQYAFEDRAANLAQVLGDTPPDYGFDFAGTEPWVWRGDGFLRVVEATPDGDRYYYYDAGSSSPYLIQDGGYAYAYSGGDLVVIYGPDGQALGASDAQDRTDLAGRYLVRARALYNSALAAERRSVALDAWRQGQTAIEQNRSRWEQEQARYPDWRAYHDAHQAEDDAYWQGERDRRSAEADSYRQALGGAGAPAAAILAAAAAAYGATHAGAPGGAPRAPLSPGANGHGQPPPHNGAQSPLGGQPQPSPDTGLHHDQHDAGLAPPPAPSTPQPGAPGAGWQDHRQAGAHGLVAPPSHEPFAPPQPVALHSARTHGQGAPPPLAAPTPKGPQPPVAAPPKPAMPVRPSGLGRPAPAAPPPPSAPSKPVGPPGLGKPPAHAPPAAATQPPAKEKPRPAGLGRQDDRS